jgi:hypothetical protein
LAIETETWQLGKVLDKIKANHTYPEVMNYWAQLDTINKEEETDEMINSTTHKAPATRIKLGNKWTRRLEK